MSSRRAYCTSSRLCIDSFSFEITFNTRPATVMWTSGGTVHRPVHTTGPQSSPICRLPSLSTADLIIHGAHSRIDRRQQPTSPRRHRHSLQLYRLSIQLLLRLKSTLAAFSRSLARSKVSRAILAMTKLVLVFYGLLNGAVALRMSNSHEPRCLSVRSTSSVEDHGLVVTRRLRRRNRNSRHTERDDRTHTRSVLCHERALGINGNAVIRFIAKLVMLVSSFVVGRLSRAD
jgi:hypothetical protein